jgi:hypothetical protein
MPPTMPERTLRLRRWKSSCKASQILGRYASCNALHGTAQNVAGGGSL